MTVEIPLVDEKLLNKMPGSDVEPVDNRYAGTIKPGPEQTTRLDGS
jgi:hypothetical protein